MTEIKRDETSKEMVLDEAKTSKEMVLEPSLKKDMESNLENMLTKKEKNLPAAATSTWKLSDKGKEAVSKALSLYNTEFGLYASIPMMCKGDECVYAQLFPELHEGLSEEGQRCPVEIALIMSKYEAYKKELEIQEEDAVDMSILRDVIDYDVQIVRAENKMAMEGDFVKDVVVGVNEAGVPLTQEQISQAAQYKANIQNKRNSALKMLNSTRKDKAGEKVSLVMDPSSYAKELLKDATITTVDADFEELDVIPDVEYGSLLDKEEEE